VLAYDYPLLGVFWTLVLASLFFVVIFTIVWALFDNFRRKAHSGWAKAGWASLFSSCRSSGCSSISSLAPLTWKLWRGNPSTAESRPPVLYY
jgi:ABC-type multidrug transport system permease subunit